MNTMHITTPVVIATTTAMTASSLNASRKRQQEYDRCSGVVKEQVLETVADKQDYAHCVDIIYPQPASTSTAVVGLLIGSMIVAALLALWLSR